MLSRMFALSLKARLRLAFLLAMFAAGIPATLALKAQVDRIADSRQELSGVDPALAAIRLVFEMQTHRRATVAALAGDTSADEQQRAPNAERVDRQFVAVREAFAASGLPLDDNPEWRATLAAWPAVKAAAGARIGSAHGVIEGQTGVIMSAIGVVEHAGATSGLLLDPSEASYYLVVNALGQGQLLKEYLGRLRGHGLVVLASSHAEQEQRLSLYANIGKIHDVLQTYRRNLDRAVVANPELGKPLAFKFAKVEQALESASRLAQRDLVDAKPIGAATGEYAAVTRLAIDTIAELNDATLQSLRAVLQERIASDTRQAALLAALLSALIVAMGLMLRGVNRAVQTGVDKACRFANAIADQDLSQRLLTRRADEVGDLFRALDRMGRSLAGIVGAVRTGAAGFATTSHEISAASSDLSARTEQTASSLEQTAASMSELTDSVKLNAEAARQAHDFASSAAEVAGRGGSAVSLVVSTMEAISGSSRRIADIIGTIDGIAFQTNILALNAAVEAARAGEQGRGFAVVASEVRGLARRSAEAAKEIKSLISASVESVESGAQQVRTAGETMREIVASIDRVTQMVTSISASTQQQSQGIAEINQAVEQLDEMTQQNAAMVEQSAAASDSLKTQAAELSGRVAGFRMAEDEPVEAVAGY